MQVSIEQKLLATNIKALNKCLSRRPHLPILGGIHLKTLESALEMTVTDMSLGLKVRVPAQIDEPGETTVVGKNFIEAISFFDDKQTSLTLEDTQMLVKNGRDRVKIPVISDDYPQFDDSYNSDESLKKKLSFWEYIGKNIAFAASSDQSRPALTGILLKAGGQKTQIVCTDGFRLAIWETKEQVSQAEELEVIISAKAVSDLITIAGVLDEEQVQFYHNPANEQVIFAGEHFVMFSKLISANYPPFSKIVPLEFATEVTLSRELLARNLTKASVFTRADSNTVKLHLSETEVGFEAASLGDGSFQGQQEVIKMTGSSLDIAFNIKYLLDFLSTRGGETIWLGCNGPTSPAMLKDPGESDLIYIAMPFKPKN